jgi:hypothetical protein
MPPVRSGRPELLPTVHGVYGTSDLEIGWTYTKQFETGGDHRSSPLSCFRLNEGTSVDKKDVMSQQSVRQRRDAQS